MGFLQIITYIVMAIFMMAIVFLLAKMIEMFKSFYTLIAPAVETVKGLLI